MLLQLQLAKEIVRRNRVWEDKVWSRRYQAIVISEEEEVQVARLPPGEPTIRGRARGQA